jgi:hypothetical protein
MLLDACQTGTDADRAATALDCIRRAISEKEGDLDQLGDLASFDSYACLLHLWDRLRVWFPGRPTPVCHPDAAVPLLLP